MKLKNRFKTKINCQLMGCSTMTYTKIRKN